MATSLKRRLAALGALAATAALAHDSTKCREHGEFDEDCCAKKTDASW